MAHQSKSYKKFVATAATATIVASAVVPAAFAAEVKPAAFTDVPSSYAPAIDFVVKNSFSKGLTPTQYGIADSIKRGDAAVIIANAASLNDKDAPASGFRDVPNRAALAINSLKAAGVVNGKSATNFGFADSITRGEAAIMLQKAFDLKGGDTKVPFSDVSDRYKDAVAALMANDVTNGISATQFGTQNPIKRGDFAKFIYALEPFIVVPGVEPSQIGITFGKGSLVADGTDTTTVTLTIKDPKTGAVATDADNIVLELSSSHGSLNNGNTARVIVQDGVATATLQSDFHQEDATAVVTAKLVEAAPDSKWHDQIGNVYAEKAITFKAVKSDSAVDPVLRSVDTDEADRVTLVFDKAVNPATFVETINGRFAVDAQGNAILRDDAQIEITSDFSNGDTHNIRGIQAVKGNPNAVEVILAADDTLTASSRVTVEAGFTGDYDGAGFETTTKSFTFTDALKPEATSVTVADRNTLVLNFSEPVLDEGANITINGGKVPVSAITAGEFNQNTGDKRHQITVDSSVFFPAGNHSVQISGVTDYAGNVIASDSLDFSLPTYDARPNATIKVESPEQFRVNFTDPVTGFDADELSFEIFIEENDATTATEGEWVEIGAEYFDRTTIVAGTEYVYELNTDLSRIFEGMDEEYVNYSNYEFRAVIDADTVTSSVNGLNNSEQIIGLNYQGSPLNEMDNVSPKLVGTPYEYINEAGDNEGFVVSFDEPVKAPGFDNADTPSVEQGEALPNLIVEFQGTNAAGQKITVAGEVAGYFPDGVDDLTAPYRSLGDTSADNELLVRATQDLQDLVDEDGYGSDWTLVVRNVTDDVGNAALSLSKKFEVKATPVDFEVETVDFYLNGEEEDEVVIDFTDAVRFTGNETNALRAQNYKLNGAALPQNSTVALGDDDVIEITLPDGTLLEASNTLTVSKSVTSANGTVLTGKNEFVAAPTAN
ncbi:S-layer homology domain-containing protein [Planococcus sp. N064]|uniref:S-layer homology domain-containing protein n=1 Tax=Planococcus liqunii TaxID=3058394 RepID=A0ABT8MNM9_9BACL|nr:S-layer homology domain-containing protein [Planococcus sp. N064]MDN7226470.1 S-layer homology domain-containing protein [Planococcus sp. N064]